MRILLVQAWLGRRQHPVLPLGLASIAASLDSHNVRIEDLNLSDSPMERLRSILVDYRPEAIGFSLRNADTTSYFDRFSYIPAYLEQIKMAATVLPNAHILVGGAGFSIFADQIMSSSSHVHCGVTGHGELLVEDLIRHRGSGVYHGKSGSFLSPGLDLLELDRYTPFAANLAVGVEVNRGCDLHCGYCSYSVISGRSVKERPLEQIRDDIERLTQNNSSHIFLIAPILNNRRERGIEVSEIIKTLSSEISWEAYHSAVGFDREYAQCIRDSGCQAVAFSPDGGTSGQMKRMGKDYGESQLESAVRAAAASGIEISLNVFPWDAQGGLPEMIRSFQNGLRWGKLAGDNLRRLRFSFIRKLPGTDFSPSLISLNSGIPSREFVKPSSPGMLLFKVLNRICERNHRTL